MVTRFDMTIDQVVELVPPGQEVKLTIERVRDIKYLRDGIGYSAVLEIQNGAASTINVVAHATADPTKAVANLGAALTSLNLKEPQP